MTYGRLKRMLQALPTRTEMKVEAKIKEDEQQTMFAAPEPNQFGGAGFSAFAPAHGLMSFPSISMTVPESPEECIQPGNDAPAPKRVRFGETGEAIDASPGQKMAQKAIEEEEAQSGCGVLSGGLSPAQQKTPATPAAATPASPKKSQFGAFMQFSPSKTVAGRAAAAGKESKTGDAGDIMTDPQSEKKRTREEKLALREEKRARREAKDQKRAENEKKRAEKERRHAEREKRRAEAGEAGQPEEEVEDRDESPAAPEAGEATAPLPDNTPSPVAEEIVHATCDNVEKDTVSAEPATAPESKPSPAAEPELKPAPVQQLRPEVVPATNEQSAPPVPPPQPTPPAAPAAVVTPPAVVAPTPPPALPPVQPKPATAPRSGGGDGMKKLLGFGYKKKAAEPPKPQFTDGSLAKVDVPTRASGTEELVGKVSADLSAAKTAAAQAASAVGADSDSDDDGAPMITIKKN